MYPPREDSLLLAPFADVPPGTLLLDLGTGSGLLALRAARRGARVVATDLNPAALRRVAAAAREARLALALVRTDRARGLGRFDRILCNPPYLPTPPGLRDPDPWANLALDGGADGLALLRPLVAELAEHLRPGGSAFLLGSSLAPAAGRRDLRRAFRSRGGTVRLAAARELDGERLEVWEWRPVRAPAAGPAVARPRRAARQRS